MATIALIYDRILSARCLPAFVEQLARLRAWVKDLIGNEAITRLDAKLKSVSSFHECVRDLFEDFEAVLKGGEADWQYSAPQSTEHNSLHRLLQVFNSGEENPSTTDLDGNNVGGENFVVGQNSKLRNRHVVEALDEILHDLNDLSEYLQRPPSDFNKKTTSWQEEVNKYLLIIDVHHVSDKHPDASSSLAKRLGEANRERRARLSLLKAERESRRIQVDQVAITKTLAPSFNPSTFHDSGLGTSLESRKIAQPPPLQPLEKGAAQAGVVVDQQRQSQPDESPPEHKDEEVSDVDTGPATSYVPTTFDAASETAALGVPSPPKEFFEQSNFTCPICGRWRRDISDRSVWKRHVFRDIKPYVCVHEHCPSGMHMYRRRRDWKAHELANHYSKWQCPLENAHGQFDLMKQLRKQLEQQHSNSLSPYQISLLLPACRRLVGPNELNLSCPICRRDFSSLQHLLDHIAVDLEQIALFALPKSFNSDDSDVDLSGNDASSASSGLSLRNATLPHTPCPQSAISDYPHDNLSTAANDGAGSDTSTLPLPSFSTPAKCNTGTQATVYRCSHPGCSASPFQTPYMLNSHQNVHSSDRPHVCPKEDCPRSQPGKGFKRKNEMLRHGLMHVSPGYVCPFCPPEHEHRYPRPDNLHRHVTMHHEDVDVKDPRLSYVLGQRRTRPDNLQPHVRMRHDDVDIADAKLRDVLRQKRTTLSGAETKFQQSGHEESRASSRAQAQQIEKFEKRYSCAWKGCDKAYKKLSHLNAHVAMHSHGSERLGKDFAHADKDADIHQGGELHEHQGQVWQHRTIQTTKDSVKMPPPPPRSSLRTATGGNLPTAAKNVNRCREEKPLTARQTETMRADHLKAPPESTARNRPWNDPILPDKEPYSQFLAHNGILEYLEESYSSHENPTRDALLAKLDSLSPSQQLDFLDGKETSRSYEDSSQRLLQWE